MLDRREKGRQPRAQAQVNCSCWGESGSDLLRSMDEEEWGGVRSARGTLWDQVTGGKPLTLQLLKERRSLGQNQKLRKGFLLWTNARCTFGYTLYVQLYSPSGGHLGNYKCRFPTQGRDGLESSLWLTPNHVRPFWPPCYSLQPTKTPSAPLHHFLSPFPSVACCSHLIPKDSVPSAPDIQFPFPNILLFSRK